MITINALGDACPIPVVKTLNALKEMKEPDQIQVYVDNEIAVQNLTKMAKSKNLTVKSEKLEDKKYCVEIQGEGFVCEESQQVPQCMPDARDQNIVAVISSSCMGSGDEQLGSILMKGFIYALSQQEQLPSTILFYNGGARLTCQEAPTLEDLKAMEAQGVEILTCGTCLDYYGLSEKLQVGGVTNMYVITEKMMNAGRILKP